MVVLDAIIVVFVDSIGGPEVYYGLFALYFVIGTAAAFYKISTT